MASEYDGQIVTLLVEEGRLKPDGTPGMPIATHVPARRERYLVFLPKNAPVGQKVKVRLADTSKTDKWDMTLFEGQPAPVEYTEKWKDNGDGNISRVKIATDWLLQESEAEVMETRPVQTREAPAIGREDQRFVWGNSAEESFYEVTPVRIVPVQREVVAEGKLAWETIDRREEPGQPVRRQISLVEPTAYGTWWHNQFHPVWTDDLTLVLHVVYEDGELKNREVELGDIPPWFRAELEAQRPACSCGARRTLAAGDTDGYPKCGNCRNQEACSVCGQVKWALVNGIAYPRHHAGSMYCEDCWGWAEQEFLVARLLADEHKKLIAAEARRLLAGQALTKEEGEVVLKATADPTAFGQMAGYGWYYFSQDGAVHGTKLAPAALEILTFLPGASGNALVEFVAWIAGGVKPADPSADFYLQTQVEGKQAKPVLTEDLLTRMVGKIGSGEPALADLLRGPTVNLEKILPEARNKWLAMPGVGCPEGEPYGGKAHWEEKAVKEFIEIQFGRSYSSLGNSARRHSVYAECRRAASGNWESLKGLRPLTEPAIVWLKEKWSWRDSVRNPLFEAFRTVPSCEDLRSDLRRSAPLPEAQLDEIASRERDNLLHQREEDFWKFLTSCPNMDAIVPAEMVNAPPAVVATDQSQFGEDAALPDMAVALREKWGAK